MICIKCLETTKTENLNKIIQENFDYSAMFINLKRKKDWGGISTSFLDLHAPNGKKPNDFIQMLNFICFPNFTFISLISSLYQITYFLPKSTEAENISYIEKISLGAAFSNIYFEDFYKEIEKLSKENISYSYYICILDQPTKNKILFDKKSKTEINYEEPENLKRMFKFIAEEKKKKRKDPKGLKQINKIVGKILGELCLYNKFGNSTESLREKSVDKYSVLKREIFKALNESNEDVIFTKIHGRYCCIYRLKEKKVQIPNKQKFKEKYEKFGIELAIMNYGHMREIAIEFLEFLSIIE